MTMICKPGTPRGAGIRTVGDVAGKWRARRLRSGSLSGPAFVEFTFPTEEGGLSKLCVRNSELRHMHRLLDQFADRLPVFPPEVKLTDRGQGRFILELASKAGRVELVPDRTGFLDKDTFATYGEIIRSDGARKIIARLNETDAKKLVDVKGDSFGTTERVLKLAVHSTYLAFGLGVALAAPLPTYLKLSRGEDDETIAFVTETAVFNLSGDSSSGKSSVGLAAISLGGSPERAGTLDFSPRGLAELASDCNDLVLVLDDTEKAEDGPGVLVRALKGVIHTVPGGRSKIISRGADQSRFPQLRWSTFGLSSSPRSIAEIAAENRWEMSPGDKVRLFDISVPRPAEGGIFDRIDGTAVVRAKRSIKLIAKLERGYANHHGHIIPQWVLYLMRKDRSKRIVELTDEFIEHVVAGGNGWEKRFALKFGLVYAAMALAVRCGILPWPPVLPLKVTTRCYRKARSAAKTSRERIAEASGKLHYLIMNGNGVVDATTSNRGGKPLKITDDCVALRYRKEGRTKIGILDDALLNVLGGKRAKAVFTKSLQTAGLVAEGHGHAGTVQERIPILRQGKIIRRPRLWVINADEIGSLRKPISS